MTDLERIKKDVVEMDSRANVCWYDAKVLTKAVRLILEELTADRKTEPNSSEKPNNCEHITEDGVTCAKYPACDDCLDNPLNKVKGSERLVKGSEQTDCLDRYDHKTEPTISKMEQVETMSCAECKHRPIGAEICEEPCHYEPQTDWHYDEQDATWYPYKHEDEPQQKSCATCKHALGNWDGESNNCGRCCGADRRFYEPKDEPKTEGVENDTDANNFTN